MKVLEYIEKEQGKKKRGSFGAGDLGALRMCMRVATDKRRKIQRKHGGCQLAKHILRAFLLQIWGIPCWEFLEGLNDDVELKMLMSVRTYTIERLETFDLPKRKQQ